MKNILNRIGKFSLTLGVVGTGVLVSALLQNVTNALVSKGLENIVGEFKKSDTEKSEDAKANVRVVA